MKEKPEFKKKSELLDYGKTLEEIAKLADKLPRETIKREKPDPKLSREELMKQMENLAHAVLSDDGSKERKNIGKKKQF